MDNSKYDELVLNTQQLLSRLENLQIASEQTEPEPRPPKNRTRIRKKKKDETNIIRKTSVDLDLPTATSTARADSGPIDHRMQFLLELLRVPVSEWVTHVAALAVDKGILRKEKAKNTYVWNKDHPENKHTAALLQTLNATKKKRFLNLDETINELISDSQFHVSLPPHKYRSEADLDTALTRLANSLVDAGLGYITQGELFVTKQGNTAFVRTDPEVVLRKQKLRRCALNGDIVQVFVFREAPSVAREPESEDDEEEEAEGKDPEVLEEISKSSLGFVIRIVKKFHPRSCVGQFGSPAPTKKTKTLVFFPHERGVPPVHVPLDTLLGIIPKGTVVEEYLKEVPKRLFEVEIIDGNSFYFICNGYAVSDVGVKGNIRDENKCILLRHGFKANRIDRLERLGETYASKAMAKTHGDETRRDLTDMCIFTIDPATARDLDDAVSCRQLPNGNYEVGIHISDVTLFVEEDSDLDCLVREAKTTSVYMVDQVYHMLPSVLCQKCSLLPGEPKAAVSVFVEMTPNAEVVAKTFTRSLINSCCQLAYEQAQKIIDDEDPLSVAPMTIYNEFKASDLRSTIKSLHGLAKIMRDRRMKNGALKFDKPKYYFRLDAEQRPLELLSEMSKPANHLIEEFMILANEIVGEYIYDTYPDWAILRQHSPPKLDQMAKVKTFFRELDFPELNYRTAKEINASMDAILAESDRRGLDRAGFELVLNGLLAKPMNRAQYFCSGDDRFADKFDHFALSIPFYTHFTSPIRRYPDILVHRLLIRAINGQPAPKSWLLEDVNSLMSDCNRQKMNSRYASEDSARLFLMHFLRNNFPEGREMKATVCNVLQRSFEVKLWETGDELNISFLDMEAANLKAVKTEDGAVLVTPLKEQEGGLEKKSYLKIFSTCRVTVTVDKERLRASLLI